MKKSRIEDISDATVNLLSFRPRPRHRTILDFDPKTTYTLKDPVSVTVPGLSKTIPEIIAKYSRQSPMQVGFNPEQYSSFDVSQFDGLSKTDMAEMAKQMEQRVSDATRALTELKSRKAKADADAKYDADVKAAAAKLNPLTQPNPHETKS